jgi:hypothetical protein
MSKKQKLVLGAVFIAVLLTIAVRFLLNSDIAVLQPAGIVGQKEKNLMIIATLSMSDSGHTGFHHDFLYRLEIS